MRGKALIAGLTMALMAVGYSATTTKQATGTYYSAGKETCLEVPACDWQAATNDLSILKPGDVVQVVWIDKKSGRVNLAKKDREALTFVIADKMGRVYSPYKNGPWKGRLSKPPKNVVLDIRRDKADSYAKAISGREIGYKKIGAMSQKRIKELAKKKVGRERFLKEVL